MPGNSPGRVKHARRSQPASASAAGAPSRHRTITSSVSRSRSAARSRTVGITRWAEDHAEAVSLIPLVILLGAAGAAYTWQPATTAGVIIFLAALVVVTGTAFGCAKKTLGYLRGRRDRRQQALPSTDDGQQPAAARADDRDTLPASPEDTPSVDPA